MANGKILVLTGPDGTLLVDAQSARRVGLADSVLTSLGAPPVRWVVNTHYHGDHTEGNALFRSRGAENIGQEQLPVQMAKDTTITTWDDWHRTPAAPASIPTRTFRDSLSMRVNGQRVLLDKVQVRIRQDSPYKDENNQFNKFWAPKTFSPPQFNIDSTGAEWFDTEGADSFLHWSTGTFLQTFFVDNASYSVIVRAKEGVKLRVGLKYLGAMGQGMGLHLTIGINKKEIAAPGALRPQVAGLRRAKPPQSLPYPRSKLGRQLVAAVGGTVIHH